MLIRNSIRLAQRLCTYQQHRVSKYITVVSVIISVIQAQFSLKSMYSKFYLTLFFQDCCGSQAIQNTN